MRENALQLIVPELSKRDFVFLALKTASVVLYAEQHLDRPNLEKWRLTTINVTEDEAIWLFIHRKVTSGYFFGIIVVDGDRFWI
jgi:hypothetical protein